jgi:hypothetical protein
VTDPRWRENQEVAQAASGSANELIPALSRIIDTGHWREFEHPMHGLQQFDRFTDYCSQFLELDPRAVELLLDRSNFKAAAEQVRRMLAEDIEPVSNAGRPVNLSDTKVTAPQEKQDAAAVIARLKRDRPDLAQQVIDGDLSPNAAAITAGIRKAYARYRTDDPALAVAALLRHYTAEQIRGALP